MSTSGDDIRGCMALGILQSTLDLTKLAWEFFNAAFDYATTPIRPLGCRIIIQKNPACVTRGTSAGKMGGASVAP